MTLEEHFRESAAGGEDDRLDRGAHEHRLAAGAERFEERQLCGVMVLPARAQIEHGVDERIARQPPRKRDGTVAAEVEIFAAKCRSGERASGKSALRRFSLGVALLEPLAAGRPLRERDGHELERCREPHGDERLEEHAVPALEGQVTEPPRRAGDGEQRVLRRLDGAHPRAADDDPDRVEQSTVDGVRHRIALDRGPEHERRADHEQRVLGRGRQQHGTQRHPPLQECAQRVARRHSERDGEDIDRRDEELVPRGPRRTRHAPIKK